jgi:drug/metabolite transporter (DMT)-like permease
MNNITIAIVGGLVGMLGYGISDFIAKKSIDKIGNLKTLFYTQLFGVFFLLFYFIKDISVPVFDFKNVVSILLFGFFNTIGYLALYRAFEKGKLSIVSPISSSYAILAAVVSFLFFGETFSQIKIITLFLIILGILLTATDLNSLKSGLGRKDLSKGVPEALLVLLVFGIYVPFWDKFLSGPGWVVWVILVRLVLAFILLIYQCVIKKDNLKFSGKNLIYLLLFTSLFEAIGSFGSSWGYHSSVSTTSIVTAITSTYPFITALLAFTFLKERLAINQYAGIAIIILGLALSPFV